MYDKHDMVSFADVNYEEENFDVAFGRHQGAGNGGWPTIRYFNKQTGYGGKGYTQKTDEQVCDELGDETRMQQYVEEKSGASLCDVVWGDSCSEMELKFIDKWVGHGKKRDQAALNKEKTKWETAIEDGMGKFAQNKQRVMLLDKLLTNFDHPEL
mmetsp:Transcript_108105/g.187613  ORF Transcript_108105/g.187613 Transcript_108105/m.187613 type:complete len:155 (+) Transcript_108105:267-731(+)